MKLNLAWAKEALKTARALGNTGDNLVAHRTPVATNLVARDLGEMAALNTPGSSRAMLFSSASQDVWDARRLALQVNGGSRSSSSVTFTNDITHALSRLDLL